MVRVEEHRGSALLPGHSVSALAGNRGEELLEQERISFGQIRRVRILVGYGSGVRLLPKLLWFWLVLFAGLLKERFYAVDACDFETLLPVLLAAKLKGKKVVYDIFDFRVEGGNFTTASCPVVRFWIQIAYAAGPLRYCCLLGQVSWLPEWE